MVIKLFRTINLYDIYKLTYVVKICCEFLHISSHFLTSLGLSQIRNRDLDAFRVVVRLTISTQFQYNCLYVVSQNYRFINNSESLYILYLLKSLSCVRSCFLTKRLKANFALRYRLFICNGTFEASSYQI